MIAQGRLLLDPARAPEPGWVRVDQSRIAEVRLGEPPPSERPPALGAPDALIIPAFVDAHCHFPQTDSVGIDGLELLPWLEKAVFPAESWWGRGGARASALTAARRHLRQGTVGVAAYLTSHAEGSREALVGVASQTPLRFIAGRVGMDRHAPEDLLAEDRSRARLTPPAPCVLAPLANGEDPRRVVSANPRFAVSCSEELLAEFGWWVREHPGTWVQTHLSESRAECDLVRRLFPGTPHYTGVYDRAGLLTERTLLAHAIHLSDEELALIAQRRSIIVHCPAANTFLQAGLFDLDRARAAGVRVALGSDIAAGADAAMPRVARAMIEVAKVRSMTRRPTDPPVHVPTPAEAWDMITRVNADLLGWNDTARLEAGASADFLVLSVPPTWLDEHAAGRLIYNWDADLVRSYVYAGQVWKP